MARVAALDDADRLFANPTWSMLDPDQREAVLSEVRIRADRGRVGDTSPIPSTALIATAHRR